MARYYPINLDIAGRRCLVVGGGSVALRKVRSLIECSARVTVVTRDACPGITQHATAGDIELILREFQPEDLDGAVLVIGATDDQSANQAIHDEASHRGIPANVVDQPDLCSFTVPAVCRFGPVVLAVSTGGGSPALSKWIRERLEREFDPWLGRLAELLADAREGIKARHGSFELRQAAWEAIFESGVPELVREGRIEEARERIRQCISSPSA